MNDQRSLLDQLKSLHGLANQEGHYDAADWLQRQITKMEMRYYKHPTLGVVGVVPGHEDGHHTFLPSMTSAYSWIATADLHRTRELAEQAPVARFVS